MTNISDRSPVEHELKTWPDYFQAVKSGEKRFEVRVADRDYRVGDTLLLREFDPDAEAYSGDECRRVVSYILDSGPFSIVGVVVMSLSDAILAARGGEPEGDKGASGGLGQPGSGSRDDQAAPTTAALALKEDINTILQGSFPGHAKSRPMAVDCVMRLIGLHGFSHPTPTVEGTAALADDQGNHDCLAKRRSGEPMFITLGRDPDGYNMVRQWAERRLAAGGDPEHCQMAFDTAERMRVYAADPANKPASAPEASAYPPVVSPQEFEKLRSEAALLLSNAEGCAVNHYGEDYHLFGMPGWLIDARRIVESAAPPTPPASTPPDTDAEGV